LIFRHLGYFEDKTLSISMRVNPFKLDEIVVSTPGIAVKLFGNEPYSIMDFVVKDDSIYLNPICDAKFFDENVKPVQALDNQNFLFVDKSPEGQYHDYYVCDSETNKQELFYRVGDEKKERAVINIDNQVRGEFVGKIKQGFYWPCPS